MYNPTVRSVFHNLEKQSCNIRAEIDAFVSNILGWADELGGIIEKEYTSNKESGPFLLPKTPSEKRARNRKTKRTVNSKKSVLVNSTFVQNDVGYLDESISTRTRGAKRATTIKQSQLNITKDIHVSHVQNNLESLDVVENGQNASNATFVLPKANTRTKPVCKNKQPEQTKQTECETDQLQLLNSIIKSPEKSSQKRVSQTHESPPKETRRSKKSKNSDSVEPSTRVASKIVNETLEEPSTTGRNSRVKSTRASDKLFRSLSGSPVLRSSRLSVSKSPLTRSRSDATINKGGIVRSSSASLSRNSSKSPVVRSSSLRSLRSGSGKISDRNSKTSSGNNLFLEVRDEMKTPDNGRGSISNRTVTIKRESKTPKGASTFVLFNKTTDGEDKTPDVNESRFHRLSKTSTPSVTTPPVDIDLTPVPRVEDTYVATKDDDLLELRRSNNVTQSIVNETVSTNPESKAENEELPKKKRKVKKVEEVKENFEQAADTVRITRTKSKAIKQMMEENEAKQADLSAFAKKLLNRAKMTSMKKSQLVALMECNSSTPTNGQFGNGLPFGNLTTSKSKYHLLLSNSKTLKTPLATLKPPNSAMKIVNPSGNKDRLKPKFAGRDNSAENIVRSVTKPPKDGHLEKEIKLKSKMEKEEEAALKRQNVIKSKQEELKRKNELKHQQALKQREKLEQEKYHNMIQSEKEKEERLKIILQERQMKLKEEAQKKKMLTQQKIAETTERRRMEEEARIAKLKEMEAEEQRIALEKQKEQERQERRAQERLAEKKAREEYEMQMRQELEAERLKAEKLLTAKKGTLSSASKMQSATKRQKFPIIGEKREWDYKPRNDNDYGLEEEHSEVDSEDEKYNDKTKPAIPWAKKVMQGKSSVVKILNLEMLCEFMPCYQKSPDIYKMFKMTPSKRIKRSSSAIWNTPSS